MQYLVTVSLRGLLSRILHARVDRSTAVLAGRSMYILMYLSGVVSAQIVTSTSSKTGKFIQMTGLHCALATILTLVILTSALSPKFLSCQLQKPVGISPLLGCPAGTIFVSQWDPTAHFARVQDAVISL